MKPFKYQFLVKRLTNDYLYSPSTISKLLTKPDLQKYKLKGELAVLQRRARQSFARIARQAPHLPCGLVYLRGEQSGNAYPGYRGRIWKIMFTRHVRLKQFARESHL